jgi:two-component system invasion response regulator UvrY
MIKVLIVDDHEIVRGWLRHMVHGTADLVAEEAATGREALAKLTTEVLDVVLLDITLPDMSGLEVLRQMRRLYPTVAVLVLSVYSEEQYALRALSAGASGYLNKGNAPDELVPAIRTVSKGKKYVSPALAVQLSIDPETVLGYGATHSVRSIRGLR